MFRFLHKIIRYCFLTSLVVFAACALNPPVQEMSNARQSIQAAVDMGAEQYAPDTLAEARQLLDDASEELEEGDYTSARQHAMKAKEHAIKARQDAIMKKRASETNPAQK